jgi:hypothetical protein
MPRKTDQAKIKAPSEFTLEAVGFRSKDPLPSAPLPLRVDAFGTVGLPEWQRGRSRKAQDSPVLYTKQALETGALSILGQFRVKSGGGTYILKARANTGAIFKDIQPFRVDFGQGGEQFVSIPIQINMDALPQGVEKRDYGSGSFARLDLRDGFRSKLLSTESL